MTRREFLSLTAGAVAGYSLGTGGKVWGEPLRVNHQTIKISNLSQALVGIRIVLMSDFHHSDWIPAARIREAVRIANTLKPDVVALTGDFIHRGREWVPACFRELAALRARFGVFAVLGNHDHYAGAAGAIRQAMKSAGILELSNSGLRVRRNGSEFRVAGLPDLWHGRPRIHRALGSLGDEASMLLLSHNPDFAQDLDDPRVALMLSGHTHGGQVRLPILGAPWTPSRFGTRYLSGLCHGPKSRVFVTNGVGGSFPGLRINAPAEIACLTLA
ncbi:MAG: metallophosphoesterase [Terrimicrobiaceae bacterium]|nr:metallophosphoesterase [Terrimicrobiaceae bacterium]